MMSHISYGIHGYYTQITVFITDMLIMYFLYVTSICELVSAFGRSLFFF